MRVEDKREEQEKIEVQCRKADEFAVEVCVEGSNEVVILEDRCIEMKEGS